MPHTDRFFLSALFVLITAPLTSLATIYTLTDLGILNDVSGQTKSTINAINSRTNTIAVNATNGNYRALLLGSSWTNLGTLGGNSSSGNGLNDANLATGYSTTTGGFTRAFLWTPGGSNGVAGNPQMKDLGTLGGNNSEAYDINASGQISGYAQANLSGKKTNDHAFRYSGGGLLDIGNLIDSSFPNSYGYSINDAGWVAGAAYNNGGSSRAFFYNGNSTSLIFDTNQMASSFAVAINNNNRVAGYYTLTNDLNYTHAFYYHGSNWIDLGTLGGNYCYANGMNNNNIVVGGSFVDANDSTYHAFVSSGNSLVDLNTLLDNTGTGWTLAEARNINDAGQIVGTGTFNGQNHMFLLTPISVPKVVNFTLVTNSTRISFTTIVGGNYFLESRTNLYNGDVWTKIVTGISGTGGILTLTNTINLSQPERYFRVGRLVP